MTFQVPTATTIKDRNAIAKKAKIRYRSFFGKKYSIFYNHPKNRSFSMFKKPLIESVIQSKGLKEWADSEGVVNMA